MKLHLGGFFSFYVPHSPQWLEIELPSPKPLSQVLDEIGIPIGEVNLIVVNKELVDLPEAIVKNDDEVRIYPPIGGGISLTLT
jgi:sulfur carrier protein ThiS